MLIKGAILFLVAMAGLSMFGRYLTSLRGSRFCPHCGKERPCGCRKAT